MRFAEAIKLLASSSSTQIAFLGEIPENTSSSEYSKVNNIRRMVVLYLDSVSISEGDGGTEGEASWLSRTEISRELLADKSHPLWQSMHWLTVALQMLLNLDRPFYFTKHGLRSAHEWKLIRHLASQVCEVMQWSSALEYPSFDALWHDLASGVIEENTW